MYQCLKNINMTNNLVCDLGVFFSVLIIIMIAIIVIITSASAIWPLGVVFFIISSVALRLPAGSVPH